MTSDQERTIDALSLFHGGWAVAKDVSGDHNWPKEMQPVFRCDTAGDQPDYLVFNDGSVVGTQKSDRAGTVFSMSAEEVQEAVYSLEGLAG